MLHSILPFVMLSRPTWSILINERVALNDESSRMDMVVPHEILAVNIRQPAPRLEVSNV